MKFIEILFSKILSEEIVEGASLDTIGCLSLKSIAIKIPPTLE